MKQKRLFSLICLVASLSYGQRTNFNVVDATLLQARTVAGAVKDSGGQVFNVLAYGADKTGVSDSKTAIRAAVTAAKNAGGGTVYLPAGTYRVTGDTACILLYSNIAIVGAGPGSTTIKRDSGLITHNVLLWNTFIGGKDSNITVANLTMDGNGVKNGLAAADSDFAQYGLILWKTKNAIISNVVAVDFRGTAADGIDESVCFQANMCSYVAYTDCIAEGRSYSVGGFSSDNSFAVTYSQCYAYGFGVGHGFTHNRCTNVAYTACVAFDNAQNGFNSEVSSYVAYTACISGGRVGTSVSASFPVPFASRDTVGNGNHGFMLYHDTTGIVLTGCVAAYNTVSGIVFHESKQGLVNGSYSAYNGAFGVSTSADATEINITAGTVGLSNGTANFSIAGTWYTYPPVVVNAAITMHGALGSIGDSLRYISGGGTTANWYYNVPDTGRHQFAVNDSVRLQIEDAYIYFYSQLVLPSSNIVNADTNGLILGKGIKTGAISSFPSNTGSATIVGDSARVSVPELTTSGMATVSYVSTKMAADTAASWRIYEAGYLTLYGKHGKGVSYGIWKY